MGKRATVYEGVMALLAVGSVALMFVVEEVSDPLLLQRLVWLDLAVVSWFFLDWLVHGLRSPNPKGYFVRHSWELLGMIPLVVPFPDAFRLLRLVRLVRIVRVFGIAARFLRAFDEVARKSHVLRLGVVSLTITVIGAVLVWLVERGNNPDLHEFSESLWWAVVTVTTVGYGDITPLTPLGRVIAAILMVTGIGTIGLLASTLSSTFISGAKPGIHEDIAGLADLHAKGALTDDEFARAKALVLAPKKD